MRRMHSKLDVAVICRELQSLQQRALHSFNDVNFHLLGVGGADIDGGDGHSAASMQVLAILIDEEFCFAVCGFAHESSNPEASVPALIAKSTLKSNNTSMPTLYLVRHGQASFGAADYDNLSDLGHQQAELLGRYFQSKSLSFDAAYAGTLRRHAQTYLGIAQGMGIDQAALLRPGLNEYDSDAVVEAIHPEPLSRERSPENYRKHFRLLRDGLSAWMDGKTEPRGMPHYADFVSGITDVLDEVRMQYGGNDNARILICSSGGPISTAVGYILGTSAQTTIELNLRIRNTSITEFAFTPKRHMLVTYNTLPHLEDKPDWVTYA
jgi:broad specificity phosphatase PhoE